MKSENAMTAYRASQMDGALIAGKTMAAATLDVVATSICKLCRFGNALAPEMQPALDRIDAARVELGLIEEGAE